MRGNCQNPDCGHDWPLQKAPGEYKNGVRCPQCGSTDIELEGGNEGGRERETRPARREEVRETRPARQDQTHAGTGGGTLVDAAIGIADDDLPTETRVDAVKGGLGVLGDAFGRWMEYRDRKLEEQEKRAANIELGDPDEVPYPTCECGYQFGPENIGLRDSEVRCPECRRLYPLHDAEVSVDESS